MLLGLGVAWNYRTSKATVVVSKRHTVVYTESLKVMMN